MEREFVSFKIGDDPQEYKLAYDFNELADAEALLGVNLNVAFVGGSMTVAQFRGMLYAFLKPGHPDVRVKEAGGLMATLEGRAKCLAAIAQVMGAELEAEDVPQAEATPAAES